MRLNRTVADTGVEREHADPGLRIEPALVGQRRSPSALLATALMAVALALALAKPWASPSAGGPSPATPGDVAAVPSGPAPGSATATPRPRPAGATGSTPAPRAIRVADWPQLAADVDHLAGQPIVTERDLGGTDGDGTCGGTARITPFDELLAIVAPPGARVAGVRLFAIDSIRRPDVRTRIAPDRPGPLDGRATDGLTVVALPSGGIAARQYALIADTTSDAGSGRLIYTICVG